MAVVAQDQRMEELRRLGASVPLRQLATGECIHEVFRGSCLGPPYRVYHGAQVPQGPDFVPLWDHGSRVCGLREGLGGLEFIDFSIEAPLEFEHLAGTEQGFWTTRFDFLYECEVSGGALRQAANRVGWQFLERYLADRELAEEHLRTFRDHRLWLRQLVADIDRDAVTPSNKHP
jgi:hypothetical protein